MFLKKPKPTAKYAIWVILGIIGLGLVFYVYQSFKAKVPDDPRRAVTEVLQRLEKSTSAHLSLQHRLISSPESTNQQELTVTADVDFNFPDEYQGTLTLDGPEEVLRDAPVAREMSLAKLDGKYYTRESGQEEWIDHSPNPDFIPFIQIEPLAFLKFSLENADIAREKDENLDGRDYAVYSFAYPQDKLSEAIKPFSLIVPEIPEGAEVTGKIWFEADTRSLYRQEVKVMVADVGGEVAETTFTDYGALNVLALHGEIVSATPVSEEERQQETERQDREERNQRRQIDLLAIRAALERIYEEHHVYPEATEAVNLADDKTEVHKQLLEFLKAVPADPQAPRYYYAYQCTGDEQYELTGVQENEAGEPTVVMLTQSIDSFKEKTK